MWNSVESHEHKYRKIIRSYCNLYSFTFVRCACATQTGSCSLLTGRNGKVFDEVEWASLVTCQERAEVQLGQDIWEFCLMCPPSGTQAWWPGPKVELLLFVSLFDSPPKEKWPCCRTQVSQAEFKHSRLGDVTLSPQPRPIRIKCQAADMWRWECAKGCSNQYWEVVPVVTGSVTAAKDGFKRQSLFATRQEPSSVQGDRTIFWGFSFPSLLIQSS